MEIVSIDVLRGEDYIIFSLQAVYNDKPCISMYAFHMKMDVSFWVTAKNDIMFSFALLLTRNFNLIQEVYSL